MPACRAGLSPLEVLQNILRKGRVEIGGKVDGPAIESESARPLLLDGDQSSDWMPPTGNHDLLACGNPPKQFREVRLCLVNRDDGHTARLD